jgi:para-nitrobenzyl esterase
LSQLTKLIPILLSALLLACSAGDPSPQLQIGSTRYLGAASEDGKIELFLGIPFAKPPVGELRWQPPQPMDQAAGEVLAQQFKPACMQKGYISDWYLEMVEKFGGDPASFPVPIESEDCLYLNVWRPAGVTEPLPAVVYIHGGSNKGGWAYEPNYVGEQLALRGVVVISIGYRLNLFGLFDHPELEQVNLWLLDQLSALNWIRDNAETLGLDRGNLTLMGESAGGNDIIQLLGSPLGKGLFQRAIIQSAGSVLADRSDKMDVMEKSQLVAELIAVDADAALTQLQAVPSETLVELVGKHYRSPFYFDAVVDGQTLLKPPREAVLDNLPEDFALLIGSNSHEWRGSLTAHDSLDSTFGQMLTSDQFEALQANRQQGESVRDFLDRAITARQYVCHSRWLAATVEEKDGQAWFYHFSRQREGEVAAEEGVYHGAELPYVFGTHDDWLPTNDVDWQLTEAMMNYWTNFIKTGNPNAEGLPVWPRFDTRQPSTQFLDSTITVAEHNSTPLCALLMQ